MMNQECKVSVMRNHSIRWVWGLSLGLLVVTVHTAAAVAPKKPIAKRGAKKAVPAKKTLLTMNLNELRDHQRYVYVPGGRDPFLFRIPTVTERKEPAKVAGPKISQGPIEQAIPLDEEQLRQLTSFYYTARYEMIEGSYGKAVKTCNKANEEVTKWGGLPERGHRVYTNIMRLRETAKRLENREAIIKEFSALSVFIDGTRVSANGAAALINGHTVVIEPGMRVSVGKDSELQVESIEIDGVVFIYKGQRLRKKVGKPQESADVK
ncbi:MAG: hypothetical protein ACYTGH_13335 [Planctomycetota bacterium]|jgi:hypothetical protein